MTWFEMNRRSIVTVAGLVCVGVVGLTIFRYQQRSQREEGARQLLTLTPPVGPGATPVAPDAAKLLAVSTQFAGTPAAEQAALLAAGRLFADGKYAEAQAQFAQFEQKHSDNVFVGAALLGVAASLEAQGKSAEALAAYDRAITGSRSEGFASQARLAKARLIQTTQPAQALALLDEVLKGASAFAEQASIRRSEILQKHPELTPAPSTNAPAIKPAAAAKP